MKKKLPSLDITNELSGASAFFPAKDDRQVIALPRSPEQDDKSTRNEKTQTVPVPILPANEKSNRDSTQSRNHAITHSNNQDGKQQVMESSVKGDNLDEIRKIIKQLGKELSTHRFTAEEKKELADIVYIYARQGVRTSENEITRIGVNWLLLDYRQSGANSVLAQLLERLHR